MLLAYKLQQYKPEDRGVCSLGAHVDSQNSKVNPQSSKIKDKGKEIMIEPEVPLKRKDQVALDEDLARNLQTQLEAELIEEERLARITGKRRSQLSFDCVMDNTQRYVWRHDFEQLDQRLQTEEHKRRENIEERSRCGYKLNQLKSTWLGRDLELFDTEIRIKSTPFAIGPISRIVLKTLALTIHFLLAKRNS
ncbi:hypothetical protein Tco_1191875 [Tanacetum coccineum]